MNNYLTIDIGGTFIKVSLMEETYRILEEEAYNTQRDPEQFLQQLLTIVGKYKDKIKGIAACIAGFIDPVTGANTDFSVGEHFRAYNLKEELEKASNRPVILENDSNCALLGEMEDGAGKGYSNLALLTIGTGIGGAIAFDGKLYRGGHHKAGEAGFMIIGGLEQRQKAEATSQLVYQVSKALGQQVDGVYIFKHLDNAIIMKIYEEWIKKLAMVVGNTAVLLDPEVILIGGGICRQNRFIEDLRRMVYNSFPHLKEYTQIKACATGNTAGRIGALSLLLKA